MLALLCCVYIFHLNLIKTCMSKNTPTEKFQHNDALNTFFIEHPNNLLMKMSDICKILNIPDYRIVKRYLAKHKHRFETYHQQIIETLNTSTTSKMSNYSSTKNTKSNEFLTLEEYCKKYHIPFDKVTSAKFVNHQNQASWNVVCDLTKISETHLNEYFDRLKESIVTEISPVNLNYDRPSNDASYWFLFSDKHVGAKTKDTSMFGNYYDVNVFRERMMSSLENYIDEAKIRGRFDKVFICDFGDALDGWNGYTTRGGHQLPQNATNRETFDEYVRVMIEFIDALIAFDLANEYEMIAVTNDNHSGDFGYICNRSVEIFLNVKYPQIKTRMLNKFIEHVTYGSGPNAHTILMCHGKDSEDRKIGFPLTLDIKTELFINSYIDHNKLTGNIHFIKGDLHQSATNYGKRFRYRNVLSLYGSSGWVQNNFGPGNSGVSVDIIYKNTNKVLSTDQFFE